MSDAITQGYEEAEKADRKLAELYHLIMALPSLETWKLLNRCQRIHARLEKFGHLYTETIQPSQETLDKLEQRDKDSWFDFLVSLLEHGDKFKLDFEEMESIAFCSPFAFNGVPILHGQTSVGDSGEIYYFTGELGRCGFLASVINRQIKEAFHTLGQKRGNRFIVFAHNFNFSVLIG